MPWTCPLCGTTTKFLRPGTKPSSEVVYGLSSGSGRAVCRNCAKNRLDEINRHNIIYDWVLYGIEKPKKDPNCNHKWIHPFKSRWVCSECGAEYNIMCGCGGSGYVCQNHYEKIIETMKKESGSVEEFLNKHSW